MRLSLPFLQRIPIKRKLTLIIMLTSAIGLLLASALFIAYEWVAFRRTLTQEQTTLGRIVGANTAAALLFNDAKQAEQVLSALAAEPRVITACIYTPNRHVFAVYQRIPNAKWSPPAVRREGNTFDGQNLATFLPIVHQKERIGTVYLLADGAEMRHRLVQYAGIVALVLLLALLVALVLSSLLQRVVSEPILNLADTARDVSQRKDYSLRAKKYYEDEVGRLIDAFNEMLGQIETSDASLKAEIAERKAAEQKLQELAGRLEASNRELTDFAYVASHDLQEPLRKIQAFGDRLRTKFAATLGETGQDYLARMGDAASRMQTLITDLLSFSRVTTKAQPFLPVDLNEIALGVLSDLEVRIEQTKGRVAVESLPTIDADALQMRQLFQNLIGNALKFNKPGQPPVIHVTGEVRNGSTPPRLELVVSDNGIGFDQKYAEKIFVIFQRLHGRGEYEGTGVGLAIVKKIVERHGGSIAASSTPGEGATFRITLPVQHNQGEPKP
jgi:signal transduction histidine kinase